MLFLVLLTCRMAETGLARVAADAPRVATTPEAAAVLGDAPPAPPDAEVLWVTAALPVFSLTFAEDDWAERLEGAIPEGDCDERAYTSANLVFTNPATGGEEHWPDVGVRYRGHSALTTPNYATHNRWGLKLDFDALVPGRAFHGVERLNLLGTEGDPSLLRERMALEVMADSGVPAPAANYAWLVVNEEPLGLFPLVQEPDDRAFVEAHFPASDGHLYKVAGYCHGAHMGYAGSDVSDYDGFEAKAGTVDADKATDLIPMFACLTEESEEAVQVCLTTTLDVDEWLAELAVDAYVRNIDGMAAAGHNYLLYAPPAGRMVVYPYDLDLAWYKHEDDLLGEGIFDLRPKWQDTLPLLPALLRTTWKEDYCAAVLEVAAREGHARTARVWAFAEELRAAIDADPFLSRDRWEDAVDDLAEEVEERHADVVRDATECEIPPPPAEPADTGP